MAVVIAAGSGLAVGRSPEDAALDGCLQALSRSGQDHADLALVFTTPDAYASASKILHVVRRVTGARTVVGCSGAGVLTDHREVEGETAVAVLTVRGERLAATPCLLEDQKRAGAEAGFELADQLGATVAEGGCLLLLPDAIGLDPPALLSGLREVLGFVPVVGGVAAGMPLFELFNTEPVRGGIAGVAVSGPRPVVGVAQGCMPIGAPYVITRAEENVIHEIGSRPAVEILKEAISSLENPQERIRRAGIFAGLAMDPAKSPLDRGDFLVRSLVGVDQSTGAIAVAEPVRVGQTIQFQIRDAQAAREDLRATLRDLAERLGRRPPAFGCYFNCAGRGQGLFGVADHDVRLIREHLGEFPLAGFFGNGEFAPVGHRNFFHTYTGALVVFPSDPA
ncbi:MAG: FIST C-terminal domain-containing protein [Candidatus Rokubacteria bacterium]|nr:FIST C-terminal domain-containing protein [Candidatus Rokubacteria bacterium]